jgi:arylsulfatase A-like enzyme
MRFPRRWKGGRIVNSMTETVDVPGTILELLGVEPLRLDHGRSLVPLLLARTETHRSWIFSEYLENEEAYVRTEQWKLVACSGKRFRKDGFHSGYEADNPTPGRYTRLFNLREDPGEFHDLSGNPRFAPVMERMKQQLLQRFLQTHPEASSIPQGLSREEQIDFFLRPRDSGSSGSGPLDVLYGMKEQRSTAK